MKFQVDKKLTGFTIFVIILCLLNLLINNINGRFFVSDFKVYYLAAKNLIAGGNVYFIAFGEDSGFYKYSPLTLMFFLPYTLLNLKAAAIIHFCILSIAYWYSFLLIRKMFKDYFFTQVNREGWLLSLAVISTMIFLVKELYLGNINILLIMLLLIALTNLTSGKEWKGAVILGLVVLTKPFFLLLILPLMLRKKFRALMIMSITILAGFLIPFLFLGINRGLALHLDWFKTVLGHSSDFPSLNSIDYLLKRYFFPGLPGYFEYFIILSGGLLSIWFIISNLRQEKKSGNEEKTGKANFIFEWFIIMAMIPNITKTDTEHFLASIPIITFIIYYISVKRKYFLSPVMVVLIFFYGANSQDLLGAEFSKRLFYMGLIGFSNLLLIVMSLILFLDWRRCDSLKLH